jgi:hypothetical protein
MIIAAIALGCTKHYRNVSIQELENHAPFKAKVEDITILTNTHAPPPDDNIVAIWLKADNGERIAIPARNERLEMIEFARSLKKRGTYEFPKTWIEFRNRQSK